MSTHDDLEVIASISVIRKNSVIDIFYIYM